MPKHFNRCHATTKYGRRCKHRIINVENNKYCKQHQKPNNIQERSDEISNEMAVETSNEMSIEINSTCCFCNEPCNPCSQSCGHCLRSRY